MLFWKILPQRHDAGRRMASARRRLEMSDVVPADYSDEPSASAFPRHVGQIFRKTVEVPGGEPEQWTAIRIGEHHVNAWGFAHGGLIACLAEIATARAAWDPAGPPVVGISLTTQFLRAPKLGQLLEIRSQASRRTRSLVFVDAQGFADGELQFTATAVNKVVNR
jgi:acyl-coenzyme A thioesterase PaaI-like protein